jgi:hypothetical protein
MTSSAKNDNMSSSELLLLSLSKYYSRNNKLKILKDIIDNKSELSLRLIDWYVTNYCKQHNIVYILNRKNNKEYFNVYMNYRAQLKAFKKVLFDPFRRRDRIMFCYDKNNCISTTIGQLNFFRWAIDNNVFDHLLNDIAKVENDMLIRQKCKDDTIGNNGKETVSSSNPKKKDKKSQRNTIKKMTTFSGDTLITFK